MMLGRLMPDCQLCLFVVGASGLTETLADVDAETAADEADGSEEMAARMVALKVPSIWSSLFISIYTESRGQVDIRELGGVSLVRVLGIRRVL
jgi:hypothetical protein